MALPKQTTCQNLRPQGARAQLATDSPEKSVAGIGIAFKAASVFDLESADARIKLVLQDESIAGEQFRLLRAKLSFLQRQQPLRILLISSAVAGEGKTLTACSLASVLAQERGKRVLLIDADLRRAGTTTSLGLRRTPELGGLSQILQGEASVDDVLLNCANRDLHFLPAGRPVPNPADLLSSHIFQRELKNLMPLFDWILIDSPPIIPLADANLLVSLCDGVLLVVHATKTPAKYIKQAIERIGKPKLCGVVLNCVQHPKSSPYYYYKTQKE